MKYINQPYLFKLGAYAGSTYSSARTQKMKVFDWDMKVKDVYTRQFRGGSFLQQIFVNF